MAKSAIVVEMAAIWRMRKQWSFFQKKHVGKGSRTSKRRASLISHFSDPKLGRASGVHDYIKERTIKIGKYIVETKKTVRTIAKEFGVSKSTVHKDLTERLPEINPELANEVKEILDYHKSIRHLRGGEATKLKYRREEKEGEIVK
jgi:putative DeoR family transcriptional regulator, stage III sporulation protein D